MYTLGPAHPEILAGSSPRGGARLLGVSRAPQGWSRAFWGGAGLSSQNSARLLFGLLAGTWAPATCGLTGCAGFVHPSHPTRLNKRTFPHLWAW